MEKFYMQDEQKKKESKLKKGLHQNVNFSVALSFVVAAFALFSIVSFGIINNQKDTVSYAAPDENGFKLIIPDRSETVVSNLYGVPEAGSTFDEWFETPLYYADSVGSNNRVFCIEMRQPWENDSTYTAGDLETDPGLLYILSNTMASGKSFTSYKGTTYKEYVEVWATQAAIWLYLAEKYPNDTRYKFYTRADNHFAIADAVEADTYHLNTLAALQNTKRLMFAGGPHSGLNSAIDIPGVAADVQSLVAKAKTASSPADVNLTINCGDQYTAIENGKYFRSPLMSVIGTPANSLKTYDIVSVTGIDGAKITDENGKDMTLTNIAAGKKFYIKIPANKVSEKAKKISVLVNGHFEVTSARKYVSADKQTVVRVEPEQKTKQVGHDFEFAGSLDTGMNAAQTIYFIGLIVLLCGVGIVYANTKPVESKQ